MRTRKSATSAQTVDLARFELFLNVFVRTPERRSRRSRSTNRSKRWQGQVAR